MFSKCNREPVMSFSFLTPIYLKSPSRPRQIPGSIQCIIFRYVGFLWRSHASVAKREVSNSVLNYLNVFSIFFRALHRSRGTRTLQIAKIQFPWIQLIRDMGLQGWTICNALANTFVNMARGSSKPILYRFSSSSYFRLSPSKIKGGVRSILHLLGV